MAGNTKPNLWYLLILGAAGAGLALDTFVIRAKASTEPVLAEAENTESASAGSRTLPSKAQPLGDQFDLAHALLDEPAFRRLDGFAKPKAEVAEHLEPTKETPNAGFGSRHRLTAVLSQPSGDLAVVDGLLLRLGDTIEGLRLVKIENDGAIFESEGKSIRLPLARPGLDR